MNDFWYACDPDWDEALGPMTRAQLDRLIAARKLPRTVLVWHPDQAEWLSGYSGAALAITGMQAVPAEPPRVIMSPPAVVTGAKPQGQKPAKPPARSNPKPAAKPPSKPQRPVPPVPKTETPNPADLKANQAFAAITLRRLGARIVDVLLVMPILAAVLVAWSRASGMGSPGPETAIDATADSITLTWLGLVLAIPAEALMLAMFGMTPGKALFGLRVRTEAGSNPGLFTALGRQGSIFLRGMALGIPVLNLIAVLVAGVQTLNDKHAPWDRKRRLVVEAIAFGGTRLQFALIALVLALAFAGNDGAHAVMTWFGARYLQ